MTATFTYGLLIRRANRYGTEYVETCVVRREVPDDVTLRFCSESDPENDFDARVPKRHAGKLYGGIATTGFISDHGDNDFIGHQPHWHGGYLDARKLKLAHQSLSAAERAIRKACASEPGDVLVAICSGLGLTFVATEPSGDKTHILTGGNLEQRYVFWTVAEGKNIYRQTIEEARRAHRVRVGKEVA